MFCHDKSRKEKILWDLYRYIMYIYIYVYKLLIFRSENLLYVSSRDGSDFIVIDIIIINSTQAVDYISGTYTHRIPSGSDISGT